MSSNLSLSSRALFSGRRVAAWRPIMPINTLGFRARKNKTGRQTIEFPTGAFASVLVFVVHNKVINTTGQIAVKDRLPPRHGLHYRFGVRNFGTTNSPLAL